MAYVSIPLVPILTPLPAGNNSILSGWVDKRSATSIGLSIVVYGGEIDGYATIETSNAIVQPGNNYNAPNNSTSNNVSTAASGDDAQTLPDSQQNLALNPTTGLWGAQWQISQLPARWVRVRVTASSSNAGLTCNIYANAPLESA